MKSKKSITLLSLVLIMSFILLKAQTYQEYNPNDERFKIIALEKAKIRLDWSEQQWQDAKEMFENNFISREEFSIIELQYKNDKLNYEQYLLSVIFDSPYITILSANKIKDANGEVFVDLKIKNSTGGNINIDNFIVGDTQGNRSSIIDIHNLYVSIQDFDRKIMSQPYEHHIPKLGTDATFSMRFKLLKDVDSAIVSTSYGDKVSEKLIYFTRKQDSNLITITPEIYAQEIETGAMATFRLNMEYFGESRQSFTAELVGLPAIYTWDIISLQSQIAMSRIVFAPSETAQSFGLRVRVPERTGNNIEFDVPIDFKMILKNTEGEKVGEADLQIVPTGRVSIRLLVQNMYWKGNDKEDIVFTQIRLENEGMKPITNVSADILLPADWEYEITPATIEVINPNERIPLEIKVKMSKNVLPGIYQIRYKMTGNNASRTIQTSEIEFKAEVVKKTNFAIIILSVIFSIAIIIGAIWFIMKISRN